MRTKALPVLLVGVGVCATAAAQPIDLQLFRPAMDSKGYITLNASQVLGHLDPSFGLVINWARRPLSLKAPTPTGAGPWRDSEGNVIDSSFDIDNMVTANLQAAIGLFKHFEVGLGLPLTLWNGDTDPPPSADPNGKDEGGIDGQGAGDLGLHLKGRILNTSKHPVGLGVVLSTYLPTGDDEKFLGSGRVTIHPSVIVDKELWDGRLMVAANVGARIRTGEKSWTDQRLCDDQSNIANQLECGTGKTISTGHHLTYGVGAALGIVKGRLDLVVELTGQTGFRGFADPDRLNSAHEILGGFKLYLAQSSYFAVGVGRGLRGGGENYQYGSPDVRLFGAFIFEPSIGDRDGDGIKDDVDRCPDDPEDQDDFEDEDGCPDPDNDRDGFLDKDDKCPNEPEDRDGYEDDDGCPEPNELDRDGDGIPDDRDKCPDDPEDKDRFEDEDGCPDPDNDKDRILDVDDLCPNDPEDRDGFEDKDGCPDPDNDKDRILDVDDKCPNEPENYNGYKDEDGCPDPNPVRRGGGILHILEKIYFETDSAVIKPVSYPILDAVAAYLRSPGGSDILLVEVQGHADERGTDAYNLRLTGDRAHAVKRYLEQKSIAPSRLRARGYGERRPIDRRHTPEAWSKNRRVEFVIKKRAR
jgi:outer membrane protein OmpA-like peptidoglycan-associated protein